MSPRSPILSSLCLPLYMGALVGKVKSTIKAWCGAFLKTTSRVMAINAYITPTFCFQGSFILIPDDASKILKNLILDSSVVISSHFYPRLSALWEPQVSKNPLKGGLDVQHPLISLQARQVKEFPQSLKRTPSLYKGLFGAPHIG